MLVSSLAVCHDLSNHSHFVSTSVVLGKPC